MAKDILITPADGDIVFDNSSGAECGAITQNGNDLVISNAVGDILLGDGASDIYIGDGTNNVDILFEQSGNIKAEDGSNGVTLTIGSSDTTLVVESPTLNTFDTSGTSTFSGDINVGVNDTGHDVKLFGATAGAYMLWDQSEDGLIILHPSDDAGLEIYTVSGTTPTTPQFKVGRNAGEYFGVYTDDRTIHLVSRQDETDSGAMYTSSELWGGGSGNDSWLWKHGTNAGGSLATVMTLDKAGQLTVTGEIEGGSLDINGNADISGETTFKPKHYAATDDINSDTRTIFSTHATNGSTSNRPINYSSIYTLGGSTSNALQISTNEDYSEAGMWIRQYNQNSASPQGTGWQNWTEVWTTNKISAITDSISTTSSTQVASATAAKAAYDRGSTGVTNAASAQTTANAALPKAGGTMTGKITLDGAPSSDLHAATKAYVDAHVWDGTDITTGTIAAARVATLNQNTTGYSKALSGGFSLTTAPSTNHLQYSGQISSTVTGLFSATNNSNSVITLNRHSGNYNSQLGFSSNGSMYYRSFNGTAINTTLAWKTIAFTDSNITGTATGLTGVPDIIVGSLTATSITSSIVTSSVIYTEGSNIFGDAISDTHLFNGHITASGNISSSGDLIAENFYADNTYRINDSGGTSRHYIARYGNTISLGNTNFDRTTITGSITTNSHITSSGNISAAGTITATGAVHGSDLELPSGGIIDWSNGDARIVEGETNNYSLTFKTYDGSAISPALRLDGNNDATFTGNITASGNISSSGNMYAADYFDNGTNISSIYSPIAGGSSIVTVGTIGTGVWQGTTIKTAYIGDDQVTEDKLANALLAEIDANTAKVTNSDQSKSDINALDITEVGTISSGVWQGTTIKTAYIADANITMAKLDNVATNTIIGRTADNAGVPKAMSATEVRAILGVENNSTADQSKSDIDGLAITTVGTIDTGVWEGTTIKTAYIGDDQVTEDKLANTLLAEIDANTAKVTNSDQSKSDINALDITEVGTISSGVWQGTTIKTAYIADANITMAKLDDVATNTIIGRTADNAGVPKAMSATEVRAILGVENNSTADQSKSDIDGLGITTVGTIDTGVWEGTTIKTAYIGDDQITEDKLANTLLAEIDANTAKTSNATHTGDVTGATTLTIGNDKVITAKILDDNVTAAKLANSINTDIATGVAALPKAGGTMSGAIAMGNQNITGGGTITGTTLTGTSLDINGNADISGNLTGVDSVTASATVQAEHLYSTDDLVVDDDASVGGNLTVSDFIQGASPSLRLRNMTALPGGYIEPDTFNFRFDESATAYAGEAAGIGGTLSQTTGTAISADNLKRLFTYTANYINLNTYKDGSNNVVIELTDIAVSNSANTSWKPYVFFHSAASSVATMKIELKDGDGNWEVVANDIDCVDFYIYDGFYTLSPGVLKGARYTFTNISGNSYLRMIGVIGKTHASYQWNLLKSGGDMFGDVNWADGYKAQFGNSDDLQIYHDGSNSYIKDAGTGNLSVLTNSFRLLNAAANENMIQATENGAVILYHNNAAKVTTVAGGVEITGELQADSLDIDGNADISGNITTATWAGAIIPEAKLENQSGTNTGDQTTITGNAGTVTNGVYTTGDQTIGGNKTFSNNLTVNGTTILDSLQLEATGDYITFYGGNSTQHSITSRQLAGGTGDDLRFNTYGSYIINLDSNNNQSSAANSSFYITKHGGDNGDASGNVLFDIDGENGDATFTGDIAVSGTVDGIDIATDVAANTAKTGITSGQASAITANTAKTGLTVASLKTSLAGGFGSNAVTIGDSSDIVTIGNKLSVTTTLTSPKSTIGWRDLAWQANLDGQGVSYAQGDVIYDIANEDVPTTAGEIYTLIDGVPTKADADAASTSTGIMVVALSNSSAGGMLLRGTVFLRTNPAAASGAPLYLSTTVGRAQSTAPTGTGDFVRILGYQLTNGQGTENVVYFNPDNTWVELT